MPGFFPVFSQLTPLPGTPLFKKLLQENRLEQRHWLNYRPYGAAFRPKQMTPAELEGEIRAAWKLAYSSTSVFERMRRLRGRRWTHKLVYLFATLVFRSVYFRQLTARAWLRAVWGYRRSLWEVLAGRPSEAETPTSEPDLAAAD